MPTSPAPGKVAPRQRQGRWKVWTRTLHIYASLLGLILTLFFGVTGFVLNHDDWFDLKARTDTRELTLPAGLLAQPDPLTVVERVRADCGVMGALQVYEVDPDALHLRFARPGEEVEVEIARADGVTLVTRARGGLLAAMTDLHKGDHSGGLGGLLIDATALLLITISISGFVLWLTLPKRRDLGLAALALTGGLLLIAGGYLFL